MTTIEPASTDDGLSIVEITSAAGVFSPTELSCVEELWSVYQDKGEASGYTFLVYRDEYG